MSLFSELKRRNVFKVAIAYLMVSWLILQFVDVVAEILEFPAWFAQAILLLLAIMFPIMIMFTWAFELTPQGIKKTDAIDEANSTLKQTGQQINYTIIAVLVLIIGIQYWMSREGPDEGLENTIAVMPFSDMSPDGNQEYFGDGIAEEILNVLVRIDELSVTSRTTSFSLKDQNLSIPQIAAQLDVNYIVEGSIRTAGDNVRVTAQLIDVATDEHMWSDTYDRELSDIFAIQDDISRSITEALRIELVGGEALRVAPTTNMEAYDLYLQGHQLILFRGATITESLQRGKELLLQAIDLDPGLAEAWSDLATIHLISDVFDVTDSSGRPFDELAFEAADRAVTINPGLSKAWAAKGYVLTNQLEFEIAKIALLRAIELNSNDEFAWSRLGFHYYAVGHLDAAKRAQERSLENSSDPLITLFQRTRVANALGEVERARTLFDQMLEEEIKSDATRLALALLENNPSDAYDALVDRISDSNEGPELNPERLVNLQKYVDAYFYPDLREDMRAQLRADIEAGLTSRHIAMLLHDGEALIDIFEGRNQLRVPGTRLFVPVYRPMLKQRVVKDYLIKTGLLKYWQNHGFPSFCRAVGEDDFDCEVDE